MRPWQIIAGASLLLLLQACGGPRTQPDTDGPPGIDRGRIGTQPAPRAEPLSRYGNHSPYAVLGKTYHVLPTSNGYHKRGNASWYGSKFHGRKTSSGEPYDMYQFSAAHRELPLPSYVEVTNLRNQRKVIVRVNDRGPFHADRIIDLSYAAAKQLDMITAGTTPVEVRALSSPATTTVASSPAQDFQPWLQIGAWRDRNRARDVHSLLRRSGLSSMVTRFETAREVFWRVRSGPYSDAATRQQAEQRILDLGLGRPLRVSLP